MGILGSGTSGGREGGECLSSGADCRVLSPGLIVAGLMIGTRTEGRGFGEYGRRGDRAPFRTEDKNGAGSVFTCRLGGLLSGVAVKEEFGDPLRDIGESGGRDIEVWS